MAALVRAHPRAVLGLASGDTPLGVYRELARLHREEALDFSGVHTFNLDEYSGIAVDDPRSFHSAMRTHLFDIVGLPPSRTHFPDEWATGDEFEQAIHSAGGIDYQLLGIGRNGHIGFNEPGSPITSRTRRVALTEVTREDAAQTFGGVDRVPTHAVTMGVATIREARRVRVLAFGPGKAHVVVRTRSAPVGPEWPASLLHGHPDVQLIIDRAAIDRP